MSNILGNMPPVFGSGYRGVVPAPSAADVSAQNILRADGTWGATPGGAIPSQTGNATKLLTTDGTNASWSGAVTVSGSNATIGGNLTVSGAINAAGQSVVVSPSSGTAKGRINADPSRADVIQVGSNWTGGAQDDATKPSWYWFFDSRVAGDTATLYRVPAGGLSTSALAINSTAATIGGNLTVSGTGNSSFAGNIRLPWSTPSLLSYYDATYSLGFVFDSTTRKLVLRAQSADAAANQKGTIAFESGATPSEIARFAPSTGNLLLKSDGIDSGNGKLQLADHTTSAGGIGFGTDVSLYRSGADQLTSNSSGTANNFFLRHSTTAAGGFQVQIDSSKDVYLFQRENRPMYIGTNNTTALTLDSSQNATFAGTVKIANTAQIKGVYTTTTTFDFGTIANNDASSVCTLTMTGVSSSDSIIVSPTDGDNFPQFCTVSAVPSGNSVSVRLYNGSGSSRTVGSRTIRVTAIKF